MSGLIARSTVKPERVAENEQLVRAVYEELDRAQPDGLRYATFNVDDGTTFIQLAAHGDGNPLYVEAFQHFHQGIRDRCDELPAVAEPEEIGSYRFGEEPS